MPFLFKIIAILIGIFIWKTVMASFAKARKAMRDDDDPTNEPDTCDGENGPAPQATLFRNGQWKLAAQQPELFLQVFHQGLQRVSEP